MLNSHSGVSGLLDLDGNTLFEIKCDLSLSGSMHSWVGGSSENVETLVSDFVDHVVKINQLNIKMNSLFYSSKK